VPSSNLSFKCVQHLGDRRSNLAMSGSVSCNIASKNDEAVKFEALFGGVHVSGRYEPGPIAYDSSYTLPGEGLVLASVSVMQFAQPACMPYVPALRTIKTSAISMRAATYHATSVTLIGGEGIAASIEHTQPGGGTSDNNPCAPGRRLLSYSVMSNLRSRRPLPPNLVQLSGRHMIDT
jgi:hypothetical protein